MAVVCWASSSAFLLALASQFGPASLAVLRGAQAIVGVANLGLAGMESVLPTGAALGAGTGGERALYRYLSSFGVKAIGSVLLSLFGIMLLSESLEELVFGVHAPPEGRAAILGLALLPATRFFYTLCSVAYRTLQRTQQMFLTYVLVAVLVACLAPTVVREFGLAGAATGMALQPLLISLLLAIGLVPKRGKRAVLGSQG